MNHLIIFFIFQSEESADFLIFWHDCDLENDSFFSSDLCDESNSHTYRNFKGDISYQWSGRVANFFWHTNGFMGTAYIDIEPKTEAEIDAEAETYYDYSDYSD